MVNDRGYYCWLKPLTAQDALSWRLVDRDGMQSIAQEVNAWYSSKAEVAACAIKKFNCITVRAIVGDG